MCYTGLELPAVGEADELHHASLLPALVPADRLDLTCARLHGIGFS